MKHVLVIGDIIADVYERCEFRKMCPDAPGVRALVRRSVEARPGGAANVAANLCALDPDVRVSLIGEMDVDLCRSLTRLTKNHVEMSYAVMTDEIDLVKRRIYNGDRLELRLDKADRVSDFTAQMVQEMLQSYLKENSPDLILLSDYGHGTVNGRSRQLLLDLRDRLMVDTKMVDLSVFDGSLLCKLNAQEWEAVTERGEAAPERFFTYLVGTAGALGATLLKWERLPPDPRGAARERSQTHRMSVRAHALPGKIVDVCGCGDTFLAGLAASMLRNGDPYAALQFANAAAATVVTQSGTAIADRELALRLCGIGSNEGEAG